MELKRQDGQTMVEYLLLLVVAVSLVTTFYKSDFFKRYFGKDGKLGENIKKETEFAYRHAYSRNRPDEVQEYYYGPSHPSYYNKEKGETRFFGAREPYQ